MNSTRHACSALNRPVAGVGNNSDNRRQRQLSNAARPVLLMFDSFQPGLSGSMAGEHFAATVENHPRYPKLRADGHEAIFRALDDIVAHYVVSISEILYGLGFDEVGVKTYRAAALIAFREAWPGDLKRGK